MFERNGFVFTPLAVPSKGSSELVLWIMDVPAGAVGEPHQVTKEQVFHILEGTVKIHGTEAGPGQTVIVPPGVDFELSGGPAKVVVATSVGIEGIIQGQSFTPPWAL